MIAPARLAAYHAVRAVTAGTADLAHALARARNGLNDERDRALAGEIATGTIRWQAACDRIVAHATGRSLDRLDPEVLDILRLTIFQLLHLDRVPASAAVNDAVSMTRKAGKTSAAALVNAVLRRIDRQKSSLPLPPRADADADPEARLDYLSVTLSHPRWLVARWVERHGFEAAEAWARFDNEPAALTLRVNTLRTSAAALVHELESAGVQTEPTRYSPDGLRVTHGNPLLTPLAGQGLFFVQDEASQLVARLTQARPGERVLDACASPGGKTTAIAAAMAGSGLVVATDLRGRRVDLLSKTVATSGAANVRVVRADAERSLPFGPAFDCVLLDAPCSGLGTLRRDPDIKWRRSAQDLAVLAQTQVRMLGEAGRVLRPGGRLVYSTCSSEPEENEAVVEAFLRGHPAFAVAPASAAAAELERFVDTRGFLHTWPYRDGLEAFFAAVLVKSQDSQ